MLPIRSIRVLAIILMIALLVGPARGSLAAEPGLVTEADPWIAILRDFSDVVSPMDMGFDDFSGNMGVINGPETGLNYNDPPLSLACVEGSPPCQLHFAWNFGDSQEVFTGLFFSLFGLTDTQATFDGGSPQKIYFPEHFLDLDQIDGALNEPGGARGLGQMCFLFAYQGPEILQLRLELKDVTGGVRYHRLPILGMQGSRQQCWNYRTDYRVPVGNNGLDLHRAKEMVFVIEHINVGDEIENPGSGMVDIQRIWFTLDRAEAEPQTSAELLDLLERRTYQYFLDWSSRKPASQDIPQDRSTFADLLSVGGIGFGVPAHVIGAERGWIPRADAAQRVVNVLRILDDPTAFGPDRIGKIGYKGWFYHFLGIDGRRKLNFDFLGTAADESLNTVELSTIDTSLAIMGILAAQGYFDSPDNPIEIEIRQRAQNIYDRIDWPFMLESDSNQFYLGWKPNEDHEGPLFEIPDAQGLGNYSGEITDPGTLDYYTDEALITILLAVGSRTHPVSPDVYTALLAQPDQNGLIRTYPGALFTYQFLHAFLNTRQWQPCSPYNWHANSRKAIWGMIRYAEQTLPAYPTYGAQAWGISAAEGPFDAYHAYGIKPVAINSYPEEDGTVTYYAMVSSASFGADLYERAVSAVRAGWDREHWHPRFGLPDAFHADIATTGSLDNEERSSALRQSGSWIDRTTFAIDQGPMLLHLENARTGLIWRLVAQNPYFQRSLGLLDESIVSGAGQNCVYSPTISKKP